MLTSFFNFHASLTRTLLTTPFISVITAYPIMKFLPLVSVFSFAGVALASEGVHLINCNGGSSYVTVSYDA